MAPEAKSILETKLEVARERLRRLQEQARRATEPLLMEALEDLSISLEEVEITAEELHEQNEELSLTHEAVEVERRRYQELFDFAPDGYLVTDSDGVIREANRAAMDMLGVREGFLVGKPLILFVAESEHPAFVAQLASLRHQEAAAPSAASWEFTLHARDGEPFPAALNVSVVCGAAGQTVGLRWMLRDISQRRRAEVELRASREQLRALAARLQAAHEEERIQIAREVHDELGQALIVLKMQLHSLARSFRPAGAEDTNRLRQQVESIGGTIDSTVQAAIRILGELRPHLLDDVGVSAAVEWQLKEFQKRTGVKSEFHSNLQHLGTDSPHATAVYRILLDALANVARHARATRVSVVLREERERLLLEVTDNGRGISEGEIADSGSLGLLAVKERARELGGHVTISGAPGKGTTVAVSLPLG